MGEEREGGQARRPRFAVGDVVRVRAGAEDEDWDDLPLGGWVGRVIERDEGGMLCVTWTEETLLQVHPVYFARCQREGLDAKRYFLEEDDLEPYDGAPVAVEQPTSIVSRPLNPDDVEDRVRAALGLTSRDDELWSPCYETLCQYSRYLQERLSFPFAATLRFNVNDHPPAGGLLVLRLLDADDQHERYGLMCEARREYHPDRELTPDERNVSYAVPLGHVEAAAGSPNADLIRDYWYWQVD
jgi:hypothetical protein